MIAAARARWGGAVAVIALALLAGCQSVSEGQLPPLNEVRETQAATPRVSGTIPIEKRSKEVFEARGRTAAAVHAPPGVAPVPGQPGDVTLNFVDTDIRDVVRLILGTTLKVNYTIDPAVKGTATLDTATPLSRDALVPALETLLNQNGATLVNRNGLYAVVPIGSAMVTNTVAGASAGTGSQVVTLRYASAKDLAKLLEPFVGEGGKLTADPAHNTLIIAGDLAVRETVLGLIRAFDTDILAGQSYVIFPTGNNDPTKAAAELEKALLASNDAPAAGMVRVVPLSSVNAVLVASGQPRFLETAKRLFRLTRRVEDATARTWHVYYVQNGQSTDLENLLQRAFTPGHVSPTAPGSTAPGAELTSMTAGGGLQAGALGTGSQRGGVNLPGGLGNNPATPGAQGPAGAPGITAASTEPAAAPPATEALSTAGGGDNENRIRIIANRRNNALLIYATPTEYAAIDGMLRKIDIVPLEVLVDATIAEVTLNGALQYGTQFFFKLNHVAENLGTLPNFPPGPLAPTGLVGFAISKAPHFILQALSDVTKVKVLSAPQLLVMDNEPARLQVGQQVPVLTGTATSTLTTGAPIVNSIDYHSTGVIMQVTPRINSGGLVTLDIAQEVSDVAPPEANTATGSPTFDDRVLRTRVAVQDGQTVALAGLIRDNSSENNNGVPFLKDVPVISTLFSSQNDSRARTELLVLITPHVVHDQREARSVTEDLRNQLINAGLVAPSLPRKGLPGLANPNGL